MKFAGKKIISILLAAIMVVTVFAALPLSAGAAAGDFGFYNDGSGDTKNSKIYFNRPKEWTGETSRVCLLVFTANKVYSVRMSTSVTNTTLYYINAYQVMNATALKAASLTWAQVTHIAFIDLKSGNNVVSLFDGTDITDDIVPVSGITPENLNANIINYTSKYSPSTAISDTARAYHYFYPTTTANGATVAKESSTGYVTRTQTINILTDGETSATGGSVSAESFTQNGAYAYGTGISGKSGASTSLTINPGLGANTTLTASADGDANYSFDGWYDGDTLLSRENPWTYNPSTARSINAKFFYDPTTIRYNMTATAVGSGTVNVSSSRAAEGSTVDFSATPTGANLFGGWYTDSECTALESYNNPYTYTVGTANKTLYAKFGTGITQTASVGDSGGGTAKVSGNGSSGASLNIVSGTKASFAAIPSPQYKFDGWYSDSAYTGEPVSTADPYTITVSSTNTLYAKFSAATYSSEEVTLSTKNNGSRNPYDSEDNYTTTLSDQAKNYYKDTAKQYITSDTVYHSFVNLAEAEANDASNSYNAAFGNNTNSLFNTLYNIMDSTQNHGVVYASYGRNSLAHYWLKTDTSSDNIEDGRGVYTFFYSDVDCYNHENMQREHIWPKSKASFLMKTGLGGSDLHHLRPAYGKVNNIKSNWGFADIIDDSTGNAKSGWKKLRTVDVPRINQSPKTSLWRAEKNGETFCDYNKDVHGDIARILLYIYTRWKQPNLYSDITTTGDDGQTVPDTSILPTLDPDDSKDTGERVIYDLPTLLQWMEEDPVSEWEMQRNDLTQKIQGNRNVFIDYPELAWLLFDQEVPNDMDTPSGMAKGEGTDITKTSTTTPTDPVTLDFTIDGNGAAHITAFDNTTGSAVKNGDQVNRGDIITYYITPDQSTLKKYIEFSSDSNGTGSSDRNDEDFEDTTDAYSFSRQAGYFKGNLNPSYNKDRIRITLSSNVCVLSYNVNSKTATGGSGGSGSGMVTISNATTHQRIENGASVPNGTSITFTFTPDYGSRFYSISNSNSIDIPEPTRIGETSSYQTTFTVSSLNSKNEEIGRDKKFTVYFAQTFNFRTKDEATGLDKHINNKGMRPDENDPYAADTDFTSNFEICGVQRKETTDGSKALRFISVVDKNILAKAKSYGWVIGYTTRNYTESTDNPNNPSETKPDYKPINRNAYILTKGGANVVTVDCTGSGNTTFGNYGSMGTDTNYKYITAAVNNIPAADLDKTIIARPYIELDSKWVGTGAPSVIYGQYIDVSSGENFCACSGSWNYINSLAG